MLRSSGLVLEGRSRSDVEENRTLNLMTLPVFNHISAIETTRGVVLYTDIDGTAETLCLDRMRRALDAFGKNSKLEMGQRRAHLDSGARNQ